MPEAELQALQERFDRLWAMMLRQRDAAAERLARPALLEQARRLGLAWKGRMDLGEAAHYALVADLAVFTARPGRSRAIDRHAALAGLAPGSEEAGVLAALQAARFGIWKIQRRHELAGVIVQDVLRQEECWLLDSRLEGVGDSGLAFAARLLAPAEFHITCGLTVPVHKEMMEEVFLRVGGMVPADSADGLAADSRFAAAIYRVALEEELLREAAEPPEVPPAPG